MMTVRLLVGRSRFEPGPRQTKGVKMVLVVPRETFSVKRLTPGLVGPLSHTHTHRQTDRHTDRHTHARTHAYTHTHTLTQTLTRPLLLINLLLS